MLSFAKWAYDYLGRSKNVVKKYIYIFFPFQNTIDNQHNCFIISFILNNKKQFNHIYFTRNMPLMCILILLNNKINIFFLLKFKNVRIRTERTNYKTKVSLADIFINHLVR